MKISSKPETKFDGCHTRVGVAAEMSQMKKAILSAATSSKMDIESMSKDVRFR